MYCSSIRGWNNVKGSNQLLYQNLQTRQMHSSTLHNPVLSVPWPNQCLKGTKKQVNAGILDENVTELLSAINLRTWRGLLLKKSNKVYKKNGTKRVLYETLVRMNKLWNLRLILPTLSRFTHSLRYVRIFFQLSCGWKSRNGIYVLN